MLDRVTHFTAGNRVGPYEILGQLSQDGTGTTYKTYQASLHRHVTIKILADEYATDPAVMGRFRQQIPLILSLQHPNLLQVYEAGEVDGYFYLLMEYVEGETLQELVRQGSSIDFKDCLRAVDQLSAVLSYLHEQWIGYVGLDPANILLAKAKDQLILTDFGLASLLDVIPPNRATTIGGAGPTAYMSPEQALGSQPNEASDQYALAALTFEMLSGQRPFRTVRPYDLVSTTTSKDLPSLQAANSLVTPAMERIVEQALSKQPPLRYSTLAAFNAALQRLVHPGAVWSQPPASNQSKMPNGARVNGPLSGQTYGSFGGNANAAANQPLTGVSPATKPASVPQLTPLKWLIIIGVVLLSCILIYVLMSASVARFGDYQSNPSSSGFDTPVAPRATPTAAILSANNNQFTFGGFPILDNLQPLSLDTAGKNALLNQFGNFADVSDVYFYTSTADVKLLNASYKVADWANWYQDLQNPNGPIFFTRFGTEALFMANELTPDFIASLPVSVQPLLQPGQSLVVLADNLDIKNPALQKLFSAKAMTSLSSAAPTLPTASANNLTYKSGTGTTKSWQGEVPADWKINTTIGPGVISDNFVSPDNFTDLKVALLSDTAINSDDDFYTSIKNLTSSPDLIRAVRQKETVQGLPAVVVRGRVSIYNVLMLSQTIYIRLDNYILQISPEITLSSSKDAAFGAELQQILDHFLATLKLSHVAVKLPTGTSTSAGSVRFVPYVSADTKWQLEVPDWNTSSYNSRLDWYEMDQFDLSIQPDPNPQVAQPVTQALQDEATNVISQFSGLKDTKVAPITLGGQPAILVTGQNGANEHNATFGQGQYHSFAAIICLSADKSNFYVILLQADSTEGENSYPLVMYQILNSFQLVS